MSATSRRAVREVLRLLGGFGLCGVVALWCWWGIRALGDVRTQLLAFYGFFTIAFLAYLATLWLVQRWARCGRPRASMVALGIIAATAILARLVLLSTTPTLSDDVYRYAWDGRVQQAGMDPYRYPPDHPALASLRDAQAARINFPHLRTVYPPVTELAFRLGAWIGPTLTAQKLVFVGAEVLTCLALLIILVQRGLSPLWVVAYAWHPLVILEVAGSGHNDALGIACLWLGLAAWGARRWWGAAAAWSAAFLSKFTSFILVPWWWFRRTNRVVLIAFVALSLAPFVVLPTAASAVWESLSAMTGRFESNASLYLVLTWLMGNAAFARVIAIGGWAVFLLWWARREPDPVRYLSVVIATAALLSPVLHPWYLLWLIPCFCFWRVPAFLALSGTVVLAYTVWPGRLADGRWVLPVWAHMLEYAPVLLLGLWEVRRCAWRSFFLPATKPTRSVTS